ncbi:MAG: DEAD/DEAH box helicase [Acidobacteria bacterium]|nr:DEAD/DEAH box helicase [Acidobacteriota bacterium]
MKRFTEFPLSIELLEALHEMGFHRCTPIQEKVIQHLLDGKDVAGMAQTGTGKTLAFLVPILQGLKPNGHVQALIVCPTRELALQVGQVAIDLGGRIGVKAAVIYGGTALGHQRKSVFAGPDIVVGTPGRLIEFIRTSVIRMRYLRYLVLDEADRMLDMGFIEDVDFILKSAPSSRQTLLFSATLAGPVMKIASAYMHDPISVQVSPPTLLAERVVQRVVRCSHRDKEEMLVKILKQDPPDLGLVFTATREATTEIARRLRQAGFEAGSLSSLQTQRTREAIVRMFKDKEFRILVATDVAGRGLDITGISHVVNYDVPQDPEDYVHRIGRTARAGKGGTAITLVATSQDMKRLDAIAKLTKLPMEVEGDGPGVEPLPDEPSRGRGRGRSGDRSRHSSHSSHSSHASHSSHRSHAPKSASDALPAKASSHAPAAKAAGPAQASEGDEAAAAPAGRRRTGRRRGGRGRGGRKPVAPTEDR